MLIKIFVISLVIAMFVLMFMEVSHPSTIAFVVVTIFFTAGLISADELRETVANEGVLTLALLFIVVSVIERTQLTEKTLQKILKSSTSVRGSLARISLPLIGMSAFLNNTPLVVMLTTAIQKWCKDKGLHPSKFLLPISYLTIFGGMLTIIGTSTNLVVHGWLTGKGFEGFSFFHLAPYVVVGVIVGTTYLIFLGPKLLPENEAKMSSKYNEGRSFLYEAVVKDNSRLVGKTVLSDEFKNLKDLFLLKIIRENEIISPVQLNDEIEAGDVLVFTGTLESLSHLEKYKNLSIKTGSDITIDTLQTDDNKLVEAIVSHNSPLLHKKIKNTNFKNKYDASIVSVHRKNENIDKNIGDINLKVGDVLLLLAGENFERLANKSDDFYALTELTPTKVMSKKETIISVSAFLAMILSVAFGVFSMFEAVLLTLGLFLIMKLLDSDQIKKNMPFQVLLLIVSSLGVGKVIETSGTAEMIASTIINSVSNHLGAIGLLAIIYLITNFLTEVVTNTAAAVIVLPIAMEVAIHLNMEPNVIAVIVAIAASASFSTPIGYQTNLIVYGPGGYRFLDYLKIGLPLNLIFLISTIGTIYFFSL